METQVQNISPAATKTGKTIYKVRLADGQDYSTFDAKKIEGLKVGMVIEADVNEVQDGQYTNRYFNGWKLSMNAGTTEPPLTGQTQPAEGDAATATTGIWETRDRRIAMESAYSTTARFYLNTVAHPADIVALARWIAQDIIDFGDARPLRPPPAKEAPITVEGLSI